jgi:hypothetical protein
VTQPFDHSRFDWYPNSLGGPGQVSNADGSPRPTLTVPLRVFGVHYGGAGASWTDLGDTAVELRGVEMNHARPSGKPNEYNSASDSAGETWEYAGRFRAAHSSGNNGTVWGHLVLYGLEQLTEAEADGLIRGVRRARAQCVTAGYITADHVVEPHNQLPGAQTSCPGPLWTNKQWWARIVAPLTPADFDIPTSPPPLQEDDDMPVCFVTDTKLRGTFALCAGRWVPWLFPVPAGAPHFQGDHPWTREQILDHQGPNATGLWRERMKAA